MEINDQIEKIRDITEMNYPLFTRALNQTNEMVNMLRDDIGTFLEDQSEISVALSGSYALGIPIEKSDIEFYSITSQTDLKEYLDNKTKELYEFLKEKSYNVEDTLLNGIDEHGNRIIGFEYRCHSTNDFCKTVTTEITALHRDNLIYLLTLSYPLISDSVFKNVIDEIIQFYYNRDSEYRCYLYRLFQLPWTPRGRWPKIIKIIKKRRDIIIRKLIGIDLCINEKPLSIYNNILPGYLCIELSKLLRENSDIILKEFFNAMETYLFLRENINEDTQEYSDKIRENLHSFDNSRKRVSSISDMIAEENGFKEPDSLETQISKLNKMS
ncbi:MAG: hypothetical protein ACFFDN_27540 [Candidatus Hodarchaeota archaeon]